MKPLLLWLRCMFWYGGHTRESAIVSFTKCQHCGKALRNGW